MTAVLFAAAAVALIGAVGVVGARQTLYSALSLVTNMVALAVIFLVLNAQFLAAVQVIIYAGAVMVLFVFIIALLNPGQSEERGADRTRVALAVIAALYGTIQVAVLALNGVTFDRATNTLAGAQLGARVNPSALSFTPDAVNAHGNVQTAGGQLFTTFVLPFEITSLLLFVAAVGAVYLTRHHRRAS